MKAFTLLVVILSSLGFGLGCDKSNSGAVSATAEALATDGSIIPSAFYTGKAGETITIDGLSVDGGFLVHMNNQALVVGKNLVTLPKAAKPGLYSLDIWKASQYKGSVFVTIEGSSTEPTLLSDPDLICDDTSFIDENGTSQNGLLKCITPIVKDCTSDGQKDCLAVAAYPSIDLHLKLRPVLSKIRDTVTLAGVPGELKLCDSTSTTACYVDSNLFHGIPLAQIDASKIRKGYSVMGVAGSLESCTDTIRTNCWVAGSYFAAEACEGDDSLCTLPSYDGSTSFLKAINRDALLPSVIKKDVVIGGVTGAYPSVVYPMNVVDAASDLDETMSLQLANLGWFDRTGTRMTHVGSSNFVAANIRQGISIFGLAGTLSSPNAWDLRRGVSLGNIQGRLPANCRNVQKDLGINFARDATLDDATDIFTLTGHGFVLDDTVRVGFSTVAAPLVTADFEAKIHYVIPIDANTFKLAATAGGLAVDFTTAGANITISRYALGSTAPYTTANEGVVPVTTSFSWPSDVNSCYGLRGSSGDELEVWRDLTIAGCNVDPTNCRYEDKVSNIQWSRAVATSSANWAQAILLCDDLVLDGLTDWRLPSLREWIDAHDHGMSTVFTSNWITANTYYWSMTTYSSAVSSAWAMAPRAAGTLTSHAKSTLNSVTCVRP